MLVISMPDMNDSFSRVVIKGREYLLRLTYNSTGDYWTFGDQHLPGYEVKG